MDPIEIGTLTTYEVASDGAGARLNFIDANGLDISGTAAGVAIEGQGRSHC
jgi:hypothetical protein